MTKMKYDPKYRGSGIYICESGGNIIVDDISNGGMLQFNKKYTQRIIALLNRLSEDQNDVPRGAFGGNDLSINLLDYQRWSSQKFGLIVGNYILISRMKLIADFLGDFGSRIERVTFCKESLINRDISDLTKIYKAMKRGRRVREDREGNKYIWI